MITKTVNEFLTNSLPNLNIAVIGDVMVDRYVFGDVSRISPEAPVPVNRVSSVKEVLGGAGNVASNLANLDCHVYLGAVAGVDDHGRVLDNLLAAATCITPNVKELGESLGRVIPNDDASVIEAAKEVLNKVNIKYIIGTRSAKGITVVAKDGRTWHNPATQQDVFDVSGAGDTVVAMMISCLASGLSMRLALHIANGAAGIVVSKVGTYPIHRQELIELWRSVRQLTTSSPLYTKEEMKALIDKWQSMDETVVFTNGCFDILHRGHITYLQEAAQLGTHLIIGLNSDASVRRLKGETRPIVSEEDRAALLSALQCVDGVVLFEEDTPAELLAYLRPNILVKGGDYKKEDIVGRESVDEVEVLSFKEGYSTSDIVKKIAMMAKEGKL